MELRLKSHGRSCLTSTGALEKAAVRTEYRHTSIGEITAALVDNTISTFTTSAIVPFYTFLLPCALAVDDTNSPVLILARDTERRSHHCSCNQQASSAAHLVFKADCQAHEPAAAVPCALTQALLEVLFLRFWLLMEAAQMQLSLWPEKQGLRYRASTLEDANKRHLGVNVDI